MSLLSDPELKLTFFVLPINSLNLSVFICVSVLLDEWVFCQCFVTVTIFCNNFFVIDNHVGGWCRKRFFDDTYRFVQCFFHLACLCVSDGTSVTFERVERLDSK